MKEKKVLLFDLGGVLIDVDYHKTITAFSQLGVAHPSELYNQFGQNQLFDQYEKGEVSSDYFIQQLKPLTNEGVSEAQVIEAWNAMIGAFPIEKLDFITLLSKQYKCFLLSNTNEIHLEKVVVNLKDTPYEKLDDLFVKCFYSHLIGKRKPDVDTFNWVINQMGVKAEDTLFIDDSPQHIEGALKAGLEAVYYKETSDLYNIAERL